MRIDHAQYGGCLLRRQRAAARALRLGWTQALCGVAVDDALRGGERETVREDDHDIAERGLARSGEAVEIRLQLKRRDRAHLLVAKDGEEVVVERAAVVRLGAWAEVRLLVDAVPVGHILAEEDVPANRDGSVDVRAAQLLLVRLQLLLRAPVCPFINRGSVRLVPDGNLRAQALFRGCHCVALL